MDSSYERSQDMLLLFSPSVFWFFNFLIIELKLIFWKPSFSGFILKKSLKSKKTTAGAFWTFCQYSGPDQTSIGLKKISKFILDGALGSWHDQSDDHFEPLPQDKFQQFFARFFKWYFSKIWCQFSCLQNMLLIKSERIGFNLLQIAYPRRMLATNCSNIKHSIEIVC